MGHKELIENMHARQTGELLAPRPVGFIGPRIDVDVLSPEAMDWADHYVLEVRFSCGYAIDRKTSKAANYDVEKVMRERAAGTLLRHVYGDVVDRLQEIRRMLHESWLCVSSPYDYEKVAAIEKVINQICSELEGRCAT